MDNEPIERYKAEGSKPVSRLQKLIINHIHSSTVLDYFVCKFPNVQTVELESPVPRFESDSAIEVTNQSIHRMMKKFEKIPFKQIKLTIPRQIMFGEHFLWLQYFEMDDIQFTTETREYTVVISTG